MFGVAHEKINQVAPNGQTCVGFCDQKLVYALQTTQPEAQIGHSYREVSDPFSLPMDTDIDTVININTLLGHLFDCLYLKSVPFLIDGPMLPGLYISSRYTRSLWPQVLNGGSWMLQGPSKAYC